MKELPLLLTKTEPDVISAERFVIDKRLLDIAGPAFMEKAGPHTPKGGTGFGVRTLVRYPLSL